jgi:hypothetical protein
MWVSATWLTARHLDARPVNIVPVTMLVLLIKQQAILHLTHPQYGRKSKT